MFPVGLMVASTSLGRVWSGSTRISATRANALAPHWKLFKIDSARGRYPGLTHTICGRRIRVSIAPWPSNKCSQSAVWHASRMSWAKASASQLSMVHPAASVMSDTALEAPDCEPGVEIMPIEVFNWDSRLSGSQRPCHPESRRSIRPCRQHPNCLRREPHRRKESKGEERRASQETPRERGQSRNEGDEAANRSRSMC